MYPNKFAHFVMIAGMAGFCGVSNAAVYDFGNLDNVTVQSSSDAGTRIGTYNIGSGHTVRTRADAAFPDEAALKDSFEFTGGSTASAQVDSARDFRHDRHYNLEQIKRKAKEGRLYPEKNKHEGADRDGDDTAYTPIASPVPEPETYAMILAGLGLIAMTLRRRHEAP